MTTINQSELTNILKLVAGLFNAAPGKEYLNEFTEAYIANGRNLEVLADSMGQTNAFKSVYPSFLTVEAFTTQFLTTLGLEDNEEAQAFVATKVAAGESFASVIYQSLVALVESTADEFAAARDQLSNKAEVAEHFSVTLGRSSDDLAVLQGAIAGVTDDPATVEAAEKANEAGGNEGETFTLTTATGEKIVGTAGDDEIRGVAGAAAGSDNTLNIGDTIDGGAGTDTLNLTITGTSAVPAGVEVKNVEIVNLNITDSAAGASFLKSSLYAGVQQLWQNNTGTGIAAGYTATAAASGADSAAAISAAASAQIAANNRYEDVTIGADVTAGFKGNGTSTAAIVNKLDVAATATGGGGTGTDASVTLATASVDVTAASATQKTISIALDGVGGANLDINGAGVETVSVSGSMVKNKTLSVDLDVKVKAVDVSLSSDASLVLSTESLVETLNLSGSKGGITVDVSDMTGTGYAKLKTLTGGTGGDKVTIDDAVVNDLTVDVGDGNDTVTIKGFGTGTQVATDISASATAGTDKEVKITLGAGNDTVKLDGQFISNISDVDAISTSGLITVADFTVGSDSLTFKSVAGAVYQGLTETQLADVAAADTLKAAADAAIDATVKGKLTIFGHGESTYVIADSNNDGDFTKGDGLIELTGVNVNDLLGSATSFVLTA